MSDIFRDAIQIMESSKSYALQPRTFKGYMESQGLKASRTAAHISVQTFKNLNKELKEANCMVFRLGSEEGKSVTLFSLVRTVAGWDDYFLFDDKLFDSLETKTHEIDEIDWSSDKLIPFKVIPKLTETSHVNLALSSQVLETAFGFNEGLSSIPATVRSKSSFRVKPHSELGIEWMHNKGQVEIDSVVVATRDDKKYILVIEAKSSRKLDSLAKHKLVYPVLSMVDKIPDGYAILPIYMRVVEDKCSLNFYLAECTPVQKGDSLAINELTVRRTSIVKIPKPLN